MSGKFLLTAQLRLAPPSRRNVIAIRQDLRRNLGRFKIPVDAYVTPKSKRTLKDFQKQAQAAAKQTGTLGKNMTDANKRAKSFAHSIFLAGRRLASYAAGGLLLRSMLTKFSASIRQSVKFEQNLTKLSMIMGTSISQSKELGEAMRNVAAAYGASSENIAEASKTLAAAGFTAQQIKGSLATLAQIDVSATFGSLEEASNAVIVLQNVFGQKTGEQFSKSLNTINVLSKKFPAEAKGMVQSLQTMGASFSGANATFNETISTFLSLKSATREADSAIATALKTISTRLQRARSINLLKSWGIDAVSDGKFKPIFSILTELSKLVNSRPKGDTQVSQLLEQLGGARQGPRLLALLRNWQTAQDAVNIAQRENNSLQQDAELNATTLAGKYATLSNKFRSFTDALISDNGIRGTASGILSLVGAFAKLATTLAPVIPMLVSMSLLKFTGLTKLGQLRIGGGLAGFGAPTPLKATAHQQAQRDQTKLLNRSAMIIQQVNSRFGSFAANVIRPLATKFPNAILRTTAVLKTFRNYLATHGRMATAGIGAVGLMAASQLGAGESPTGSALMAGGTVGIAGMMLGVNPFVTAILAATVALKKFGAELENQRIREQSQQFAATQSKLSQTLAQTKPTHALAQKQYRELFQQLEHQRQVANDPGSISGWSKFSGSFGTNKSYDEVGQELQQQAWMKFRERAQGSADSLITLRDAIVEQVDTYEEFKAYGNGLGEALIKSADIAEDGSINFGSALQTVTQEMFEQKKKLAEQRKQSALTPITISSRHVLKHLPRQLKPSLQSMFDGFKNIGSKEFAVALRQLDLSPAQRAVGYQVNHAFGVLPDILKRGFKEDTFKNAISEQLQNAGISSSIIAGVESELETLSFDQFQAMLGNLDTFTAQLLRNTDNTQNAIKALGDSTLKVRQRILDNLKTFYSQHQTVATETNKLDQILNQLTTAKSGKAVLSSDATVRPISLSRTDPPSLS